MTLRERVDAVQVMAAEEIERVRRCGGPPRCPRCSKFTSLEYLLAVDSCLECDEARREARRPRPALVPDSEGLVPDKPRVAIARPHVLYRLWDASGQLLYVGITVNLGKRLHEHFGAIEGAKQWARVASVTLQHYTTREAVLAAEAEAIVKEGPEWNAIRYKRRASVNGWEVQ